MRKLEVILLGVVMAAVLALTARAERSIQKPGLEQDFQQIETRVF